MSSFSSAPSKGGSMMPFRVSTDFNLGLFLKNEKSALRIAELGTAGGGKVAGSSILGGASGYSIVSSSRQYLFAQVDEYVRHEYWSLDIEFLISIFVPILWSTTGLYLLSFLLPSPCCILNRSLVDASLSLAVLNIVAAVLTTGGLIFAKYSVDWHCKIHLLNGAIGLSLLLAALNFSAAVVGFSTAPCGLTYAQELHIYNEEVAARDTDTDVLHQPHYHRDNSSNGASNSTNSSGGPAQLSTADSIINSFRYYDTNIVGLTQVFASVGQVTSAMILLVKNNDIKMYILWRLGKLDSFIEDMHSHM